MRAAAREMLLTDECVMSHFGYADHFRELAHLHRTIEDLISREERAELEELSKHAASLPEDGRGEFWADNHPYWWDHIIVPQFRGSFFISLMSAVELHLGRLATDAALIVDAPIGHDELRGGVYQRIRGFLQLVCTGGAAQRAVATDCRVLRCQKHSCTFRRPGPGVGSSRNRQIGDSSDRDPSGYWPP